ncbi:EXOC7-like protein [Mya arenaria]|uniref:Exocyst complex component 7 n=1 Tax=Mya arenaria TaxID=6604 RepID=A0ABY7DD73_MYAAR|nr:EXOC7-like protein [Mya arenaria]
MQVLTSYEPGGPPGGSLGGILMLGGRPGGGPGGIPWGLPGGGPGLIILGGAPGGAPCGAPGGAPGGALGIPARGGGALIIIGGAPDISIKEMSNLSLLKDSLKKSNTNTENMLGILTSFETRLRKLEQTIVPTMTTLDHVLGYYHISQEADMMIKDGPEMHGLDRYLQQMDKVLEALNYFKKHNQNTVELRDVAALFERGKDVLQMEFQTLLIRHGRPVPPIIILDLLTGEEGHRRTGSDVIKEEQCEVDIEIYSEHQLLAQIVPEKYQRSTLAIYTRKGIGRREFSTVLSIFPVVKHLRTIKPEFDRNLEGCQAPTRAKLASLLSTLGSTGAKGLEEFIDNIKHDPDKASNMPRDGTVHELTNHTMVFMEQLQDYIETAGAMLLMHGSDSKNVQALMFNFAAMFQPTAKVLSALGLNLSNKSETYSDPFIKPLKDKEKQNIKDKFTGFNKELDEILRTQKGYAIPDTELRTQMKKDNIEFIVPAYRIFLEKYRKLNFTKNPDKYIKYTVENVEDIIEKKLVIEGPFAVSSVLDGFFKPCDNLINISRYFPEVDLFLQSIGQV